MQSGLYLRSFLSDATRPLFAQLDETIEICHVARDAGFAAVIVPQHWMSHPTVWPQPFETLARLAPETGDMRLMTGIVLLPLHNPVQVAESAATLDHISKGRLTLGVGIGYREQELMAVGATRADRVPRLEESLGLMRRLWTGDEVDFEGRYWQVRGARMGVLPVQQPHPPVWLSGQSEGAVRRAARIADACYIAPQVGVDDLGPLVAAYRDERSKLGAGAGTVALSRGVSIAVDRSTAIAAAREAAEHSYRMYTAWDIQEPTMVQVHISSDSSEVSDWAVVGNGSDIVAQLLGWEADLGVGFVSFTPENLPKDFAARKEYVARLGEEVVRPMRGAGD